MKQWSVPFITETTEIYEVEAATKTHAVMVATIRRERWIASVDATVDAASVDAPQHTRITKFVLGTVATTLDDPE